MPKNKIGLERIRIINNKLFKDHDTWHCINCGGNPPLGVDCCTGPPENSQNGRFISEQQATRILELAENIYVTSKQYPEMKEGKSVWAQEIIAILTGKDK